MRSCAAADSFRDIPPDVRKQVQFHVRSLRDRADRRLPRRLLDAAGGGARRAA